MKCTLGSFVLMAWHLMSAVVDAQHAEPTWWPLIERTFDGVNLQRCQKRNGITKPLEPPANGERCARKPKTCFFGGQECNNGVVYPDTRCFCNNQIWQCEPELCPGGGGGDPIEPHPDAPPSGAPTPANSCQKPSALAELDSMPPVSCVPTSGSCIASLVELQDAAASAVNGNVLTLCRNTTIVTTSTITLTPSDLILCCEDKTTKESCVLEGSGEDQILVVSGDNFVLSGVTFRGGGRSEGNFGGNLNVRGLGSHTVVDCQFEGGLGGNAYFSNNSAEKIIDQVVLLRSRFSTGQTYAASGAITESSKTLVQDCEFIGNEGETGALFGEDVEIYASKFVGNTGGGVVVSALGGLIKLDVILSVFENNGGTIAYVSDGNINVLCGNQGSSNGGSFFCDGFYSLAMQSVFMSTKIIHDKPLSLPNQRCILRN